MPRAEDIASNRPGSCLTCHKRGYCRVTCELVEGWVSQDYVPLREDLLDVTNEIHGNTPLEYFHYLNLSGLYPNADGGNAVTADEALQILTELKMPEELIQVIDLHAVQGKKIRTIAVELGISSSVVAQRFQSAKYQLVRRLQRRLAWELVRKFKLSAAQREVCRRYFWELESSPAIARALGVKPTQISTMLNRLKVKITLTMWSIKEGDGACKWLKTQGSIDEVRKEIHSSAKKKRDFQMLSILTDLVNNL